MARVYEKKPMGERLSKYLVDPVTGCWNWTGSLDRDGYGRMIGSDKGKRIFTFAHRASYEYHKGHIGPIDSNTGCVLHTCDNPSCINPDHLYLGDQAQNGLDKKLRGRVKVVQTLERIIQCLEKLVIKIHFMEGLTQKNPKRRCLKLN